MVILIDEAVWGAPQAFADLGEARTFVGRSVGPRDIEGADALVVRSVTRVDETLLANSKVRFVGTASSGTDHVDLDLLASRGIAFAAAEGCNARTVAEYVLAALLHLADRNGFDLRRKTLGVVGVGRIGSIVREWGRLLGMRVLGCDPPLASRGVVGLDPFEQLAGESDFVTLHVPLTVKGEDATAGMVNRQWLGALNPRSILINTSRGEVVNEEDLARSLESGRLAGAVLDVWRNEPRVNAELAKLATLATPHIAGQSVEARKRAAVTIRHRLRECLGCEHEDPRGSQASIRSGGCAKKTIKIQDAGDILYIARQAVLRATGLLQARDAFRDAMVAQDPDVGFDHTRSKAASRREFTAYRVEASLDDAMASLLSRWGFGLSCRAPNG